MLGRLNPLIAAVIEDPWACGCFEERVPDGDRHAGGPVAIACSVDSFRERMSNVEMTSLLRAIVVVSLLVVSGCSGGVTNTEDGMTSSREPPTSSASPTGLATAEGGNFLRNHEVRGEVADGSLWALFYHLQAGEPLKTLWRMTGTGDFAVTATGPDGQTLQPDGAPEPHTSSNWHRPGNEWGVLWTIPEPGRWTFSANVDGRSGVVVVQFS